MNRRESAAGDPIVLRAQPCPDCVPDGETLEEETERLWRLSGIDAHERERCTFAGFDLAANPEMQSAYEAAGRWGIGTAPPFLLLHGPTRGTGKTHLAIAAAGERILRGVPVRYEVVPRFLDALRSTQRGDGPSLADVRRRAETYPALILDDLGAAKGTEWADEQLFSVLNERWRRELRTLVTTNVAPARIEERTRSRLVDGRISLVVACRGTDYRERRQ